MRFNVDIVTPIASKRPGKKEREKRVLLGLMEHYLKTGKPVGSNALKEAEFADLSSATLRNYFAHLEEQGYLTQQHSSGGRIPTHKAFRFYANEYLDQESSLASEPPQLNELRHTETREIAGYLQRAAETLSLLCHHAVFLSAPRFDHDFIREVKLVPIDHSRCLCVLITDFGVIQTEVLYTEKKLSSFSTKRLESYFHWRLTGNDKPENLDREEEQLAQALYNELMVRYIVTYSNFTNEEIHRTGFSNLLHYPEFHDPVILSQSLSLFENAHSMRLLLKECTKVNRLKLWIGDDLSVIAKQIPDCAVVAIPYYINQHPVGAVGILGPVRVPYKEFFGMMRVFSQIISTGLTRSVYKFKIQFRQPDAESTYLKTQDQQLIQSPSLRLLEDKR
jgi:heat-inducible transcriptional repressor